MPARARTLFHVAVVLLPVCSVMCQDRLPDFQVHTNPPRLLLEPARVRLLRKEKDRQSIRWQQFASLISKGAQMPEPGFALALYWQTSGELRYAQSAIQFAAGSSDVRQIALVYDWCRQMLTEEQARVIEEKLRNAIRQLDLSLDIPTIRDIVMASIALADKEPQLCARVLQQIVEQRWRVQLVPRLKQGKSVVHRKDLYALLEILHVVRDNLHIDLREDIPEFFKDLPRWEILSYYPAPQADAWNNYRVPACETIGAPDLNRAALARAADLATVAYDPNNQEAQFLQGWLIHDQFLMRSPFGIPYEFLWANPYLPGLSYYHLDPVYYDPLFGRLFLRSSWDDSATWLGCFDGVTQVFDNGALRTMKKQPNSGPLLIGNAFVFFDAPSHRYRIDKPDIETVFLVGLAPHKRYEIEVNGRKREELTADSGGILAVKAAIRPGSEFFIREVQARH